MIERETEITSGWGEYELAIKGVKAFVCENCGAISLRAEEVKMMEDISRAVSYTHLIFYQNTEENKNA